MDDSFKDDQEKTNSNPNLYLNRNLSGNKKKDDNQDPNKKFMMQSPSKQLPSRSNVEEKENHKNQKEHNKSNSKNKETKNVNLEYIDLNKIGDSPDTPNQSKKIDISESNKKQNLKNLEIEIDDEQSPKSYEKMKNKFKKDQSKNKKNRSNNQSDIELEKDEIMKNISTIKLDKDFSKELERNSSAKNLPDNNPKKPVKVVNEGIKEQLARQNSTGSRNKNDVKQAGSNNKLEKALSSDDAKDDSQKDKDSSLLSLQVNNIQAKTSPTDQEEGTIEQQKSQRQDKGKIEDLARMEYAKWGKVRKLAMNIEKNIDSKGDPIVLNNIQLIIKDLEEFAENSRKNLKEVFFRNESLQSSQYTSDNIKYGKNEAIHKIAQRQGKIFSQSKSNDQNKIYNILKNKEAVLGNASLSQASFGNESYTVPDNAYKQDFNERSKILDNNLASNCSNNNVKLKIFKKSEMERWNKDKN